MVAFLKNVKKAIGALLGAVTPHAVSVILGFFGVTLDPALVNSLAVLLASVGAWLAPKNEEPVG